MWSHTTSLPFRWTVAATLHRRRTDGAPAAGRSRAVEGAPRDRGKGDPPSPSLAAPLMKFSELYKRIMTNVNFRVEKTAKRTLIHLEFMFCEINGIWCYIFSSFYMHFILDVVWSIQFTVYRVCLCHRNCHVLHICLYSYSVANVIYCTFQSRLKGERS